MSPLTNITIYLVVLPCLPVTAPLQIVTRKKAFDKCILLQSAHNSPDIMTLLKTERGETEAQRPPFIIY